MPTNRCNKNSIQFDTLDHMSSSTPGGWWPKHYTSVHSKIVEASLTEFRDRVNPSHTDRYRIVTRNCSDRERAVVLTRRVPLNHKNVTTRRAPASQFIRHIRGSFRLDEVVNGETTSLSDVGHQGTAKHFININSAYCHTVLT